jgi:hypothetical protein
MRFSRAPLAQTSSHSRFPELEASKYLHKYLLCKSPLAFGRLLVYSNFVSPFGRNLGTSFVVVVLSLIIIGVTVAGPA